MRGWFIDHGLAKEARLFGLWLAAIYVALALSVAVVLWVDYA